MKKTVLFGLLALSTFAFADGEMVATDKTENNMMKTHQDQMSGAQKKDQKMMQERVTLMSARPESDNGWYLFADALYWHADVGSTDWAVKHPNGLVPVSGTDLLDVHSLNFKWSWGFKVGIGANIDHDMWDTNFYYTWFHTHNSNSAGLSTEIVAGVIPDGPAGYIIDNYGDSSFFSSGSINWDIHYSMFDWELGRWHYVSKNLALRPHVGIKGGWIHQNIKEHLTNVNVTLVATPTGNVLKNHYKNDFWGVGPSVGVNTMWVLGNAGSVLQHRFSLFGDFGGALMYGHFDVKHREGFFRSTAPTTDIGFHISGLNRNLAVAMLQGTLGLSWDTAFNKDRNHFMMKVGYEFQYWFRQNQLVHLTGFETGHLLRDSDDLALQGITAEFRFDF
jgi:hypothetical protein